MTPKKRATSNSAPAAITGGGVDLEIEDQTYTLVLTNRILMEIEDETGLNLTTNPTSNLANPNIRMLATVFFHMIKRAGGEYDFDRIVDIVCTNKLAIHAAILTAYGKSVPTEAQVKLLDPILAEAVAKVQKQATQ